MAGRRGVRGGDTHRVACEWVWMQGCTGEGVRAWIRVPAGGGGAAAGCTEVWGGNALVFKGGEVAELWCLCWNRGYLFHMCGGW